jgi:hypothetical protein
MQLILALFSLAPTLALPTPRDFTNAEVMSRQGGITGGILGLSFGAAGGGNAALLATAAGAGIGATIGGVYGLGKDALDKHNAQ